MSFRDRSSFRPLLSDACRSVASQILTYVPAQVQVARVGRGSTLLKRAWRIDSVLSEKNERPGEFQAALKSLGSWCDHFTSSLPTIPSSLCPGTVHQKS